MSLAAVFDLGGTKTLVALINDKGELCYRKAFPTPKTTCEAVLALCRCELEAAMSCRGLSWEKLDGLGVSLPGTVNAAQGVLLHAPFAGWRDVPARELLAGMLPGVRVCVENDVNACAAGEMRFGVGRQCKNLLWVTVSTGIGGAIIADGRLIHGFRQTAGELGHIRVETVRPARCSCGQLGCLEEQASGTSMTRYVREMCAEDAALAAEMAVQGLAQDAKGAFQLCQSGNLALLSLFKRCGRYLGKALGMAATLLDPERIVLGGGMATALPLYMEALMGSMKESLMPDAHVPFVCASPLGYDAAAIGAAAMVFDAREGVSARAGADRG